jgi:uncharacterized oxidoreductase
MNLRCLNLLKVILSQHSTVRCFTFYHVLENLMNLNNRTVFITGGGSGIGLALAEEFLKKSGISVIICGRNAEKLKEVQAKHRSVRTITCDVSLEQDIVRCVETLTKDAPTLDILINNAGIMNVMDFAQDDIPLERLENEVATNFLAPLKLTKLLLPTLQKQTNGAIVNVSSGVAYLPMPASPVYSATKAALHSFTKSLRYSLRQSNITVFEAIPPVVDTAMPMQLKGEGKSAKKMSAEETARLIIQGMENGTEEIRIGDNKLLYWASRFAPTLAETELNKL